MKNEEKEMKGSESRSIEDRNANVEGSYRRSHHGTIWWRSLL